MRTWRLAVILLLATFLVAMPVIHTHPIAGADGEAGGVTSSTFCAFCTVATEQISVAPVLTAAPVVIVDRLIASPAMAVSVDASYSLASRAPPAA